MLSQAQTPAGRGPSSNSALLATAAAAVDALHRRNGLQDHKKKPRDANMGVSRLAGIASNRLRAWASRGWTDHVGLVDVVDDGSPGEEGDDDHHGRPRQRRSPRRQPPAAELLAAAHPPSLSRR